MRFILAGIMAIGVYSTQQSLDASAQSCHPAYQGDCLDASVADYDCLGGTGDGPFAYAVTVVDPANDPYGLDNDHDGFGCESAGPRPGPNPVTDSSTAQPISEAAGVVSAGFGLGPGSGNATAYWFVGGLVGAGIAWMVAGAGVAATVRRRPRSAAGAAFAPSMRRRSG